MGNSLQIDTCTRALFTIELRRPISRSSRWQVVARTIDEVSPRTLFQPRRYFADGSMHDQCTRATCVHAHVCIVSKCGVLSLGESGRGTVAGQRRNSDGGLEGCARWRRGAPSYFTVITVTCYRARSLRHAINRRLPLPWMACKEGTGAALVAGGYCGALHPRRSYQPSSDAVRS